MMRRLLLFSSAVGLVFGVASVACSAEQDLGTTPHDNEMGRNADAARDTVNSAPDDALIDAGPGDAADADASPDATPPIDISPPDGAPADGAPGDAPKTVNSLDLFSGAFTSATLRTKQEVLALFGPGQTFVKLGSFSVAQRQRQCTKVTGCGVWVASKWPLFYTSKSNVPSPTTYKSLFFSTGNAQLDLANSEPTALLTGSGHSGEVVRNMANIVNATNGHDYLTGDGLRMCGHPAEYAPGPGALCSPIEFDGPFVSQDAYFYRPKSTTSAADSTGAYFEKEFVLYGRISAKESVFFREAGTTIFAEW